MRQIMVLLSGLLFGAGVTISGMVNPTRVLNFFDVFGTWDPTLLCVMASALTMTFLGYHVAAQSGSAAARLTLGSLPQQAVDRPLLLGAALFGLGWGLTGFCPAPALASLVFGYAESLIFVMAMLAGMLALHLLKKRITRHAP